MNGYVEVGTVPIGVLLDLSDERRAAKHGDLKAGTTKGYAPKFALPPSDRDVSEGRVYLATYPELPNQYPACARHGAMNALTGDAHIWRCSECGVGAVYRVQTDARKRAQDAANRRWNRESF